MLFYRREEILPALAADFAGERNRGETSWGGRLSDPDVGAPAQRTGLYTAVTV